MSLTPWLLMSRTLSDSSTPVMGSAIRAAMPWSLNSLQNMTSSSSLGIWRSAGTRASRPGSPIWLSESWSSLNAGIGRLVRAAARAAAARSPTRDIARLRRKYFLVVAAGQGDVESGEHRQRAAADEGAEAFPLGEGKFLFGDVHDGRTTQLLNGPQPGWQFHERHERLRLLVLLPELSQCSLHRHSQALGGAAEVDS
eukprot:scaffold16856_cov60-Phaeocystis_antarctica.AAC.3